MGGSTTYQMSEVAIQYVKTVEQGYQLINDYDGLAQASADWYKELHGAPPAAEGSLTLTYQRNERFLLMTLFGRGYDAFQAYLGDLAEHIHADMLKGLTGINEPTRTYLKQIIEKHHRSITSGGHLKELVQELRDHYGLALLGRVVSCGRVGGEAW